MKIKTSLSNDFTINIFFMGIPIIFRKKRAENLYNIQKKIPCDSDAGSRKWSIASLPKSANIQGSSYISFLMIFNQIGAGIISK